MPARIGTRILAAVVLIARSVRPNLELSIWNQDREQIRVQLEALGGVPQIARVELTLAEEPGGDPLVAAQVDPGNTTIRLAIVQRIVQRRGGRVRARGVPGEGATFWFTLGEAAT